MNSKIKGISPSTACLPRPLCQLVHSWLAANLFLVIASAPPAGTGILSGVVSNAATGNLLEGPRIEVPALRLTALTDQTGRYCNPGRAGRNL